MNIYTFHRYLLSASSCWVLCQTLSIEGFTDELSPCHGVVCVRLPRTQLGAGWWGGGDTLSSQATNLVSRLPEAPVLTLLEFSVGLFPATLRAETLRREGVSISIWLFIGRNQEITLIPADVLFFSSCIARDSLSLSLSLSLALSLSCSCSCSHTYTHTHRFFFPKGMNNL